MNSYIVTLKNLDGDKCKITIYDCESQKAAMDEAESDRGKGWLAVMCVKVKDEVKAWVN